MWRILKRGLFIMVVWGLPMVCVALWASSRFWHAGIMNLDGERMHFIGTTQGLFHWTHVDPVGFDRAAHRQMFDIAAGDGWSANGGVLPSTHRRMYWWGPTHTHRLAKTIPANSRQYVIPWWTITLITLLPAMFIYFPGRRKRRRRKLGLCTRCGYDLRGQSDTSANCPECGSSAA